MSTTTRRRKRKERRAKEKLQEVAIDKGAGFFSGVAPCECCDTLDMYFISDSSAKKALKQTRRGDNGVATIVDDNGDETEFIEFYGIRRVRNIDGSTPSEDV